MRKRLTKIREAKHLNKTEFAKALELDRSTISRMENGSASITDRNIMVICKVYNVNESWLREEIGDMFSTDPYITPLDRDKRDFFQIFDQLSSESRKLLIKIGEDILENQEKLFSTKKQDAEPELGSEKRESCPQEEAIG